MGTCWSRRKSITALFEANEVEVEIKGAPSGNVGERVLEVASSCGVDFQLKVLYSKQAYSNDFGGATRAILDQAQIPVIFAH